MSSSEGGESNPRLSKLERELNDLRKIGLAIESTISFDEFLTLAVEKTARIMEAERSALFLIDDSGDLVSRAIEEESLSEIRLERGQGIVGWVARHGVPAIVPDVRKDERFDPEMDHQTGLITRSVLCHPVRGGRGNMIGAIEVINKIDGSSFDRTDLSVLAVISDQLGLIVENSRFMIDLISKNRTLVDAKADLERQNLELRLLLDLEKQIAEADDIDSLSKSVLEKAADVTYAKIGALHRIDETGSEIRIFRDGRTGIQVFRVAEGTGFAGWATSKEKELRLSTPSLDPRFDDQLERRLGVKIENLAVVPLVAQGKKVPKGALLAANKKIGQGFDESDISLLRLIASRVSWAMDRLIVREEREREHRLATVGRLLAGVLHDLKAPITVVAGYSELLAAKAGGQEADEFLEQINKALSRISMMTEEIVSFSRGEQRLLLASVPITDFIDRFVKQIRPYLESNEIDAKVHVRTSGAIKIDEGKIFRAFNNIVHNAVEAMPGGGSLTIDVDHVGQEVVFGFTDTGQGIPEEIQGSIFQSFVTRGKEQGTGLGLAVTREIVEAHGGKISFTTVRGSGTTFMINIPV